MNVNVKVKKLHDDAVIPSYKHDGDSGFDLYAIEDVIVEPGATVKVRTGLSFAVPVGYELQIRPRSGVSAKTKLRVSNTPGTVDASYRGEVMVLVDNIAIPQYEVEPDVVFYTDEESQVIGYDMDVVYHNAYHTLDGKGDSIIGNVLTEDAVPVGTYIIRKGDRIAQGIIAPVIHATLVESDTLDDTTRGDGGFGSTGVR